MYPKTKSHRFNIWNDRFDDPETYKHRKQILNESHSSSLLFKDRLDLLEKHTSQDDLLSIDQDAGRVDVNSEQHQVAPRDRLTSKLKR